VTDKIIVEDLVTHGRHGWRRFEETYPQPFRVNAALELDLEPVAQSDNLEDTIDYAVVCERIKEIVEKESFAMIEKLAHTIAMRLLNMGALAVRVRVAKPGVALIHGAGMVAIEIERSQGR
jgi:7,8-dihydroneopterin aldolase/epimerase/oxygenase